MRTDFLTAYFNPFNWKSRLENFKKFYASLSKQTDNIHVVECLFDDQQPALNLSKNYHVVRTASLLWIKENLLNYLAARLPAGGSSIVWVDGDVVFSNPNLVADIEAKLETNKYVQIFERVHHLDRNGGVMATHFSFGFCAEENILRYGHPGIGWAIRRDVFDLVGGFFEYGIFGIADTFMAHASMGALNQYVLQFPYSAPYKKVLRRAGKLWAEHVDGAISYVHGASRHLWHGDPIHRRYNDREFIVSHHNFNPRKDLRKNSDGLLEWCGNLPLQEEIRSLLREREEDG